MKKTEFIEELKKELKFLKQDELNEVIADQEEFIRDAMSTGRSEEEVIASLGSPKSFAESIKLEYKMKKIKDAPSTWDSVKESLTATGILFGLMPLAVLLLLVPGLSVFGFLFSWFVTTLVFLLISMFMILGSFLVFLVGMGFTEFFAVLFLSLGFVFASMASLSLLVSLVKFFVNLLVRYINWSLSTLKGKVI